MTKLHQLGWGAAAIFALLFAASLARDAQGGSLDPPSPPASTMKALDDLPPSWHQQLSATGGCSSERFECVMPIVVDPNSPPGTEFTAVLDHETGVVWARHASTTSDNWSGAAFTCRAMQLGGRYGWRLPTIEELKSLTDTSPDHLPDDHPFLDVDTSGAVAYWSLTSDGSNGAATMNYVNPGQNTGALKSLQNRYWCVRGGVAYDGI